MDTAHDVKQALLALASPYTRINLEWYFKTGEGGNFCSYSNPQVDELIDQGIAVTDQTQRAEIYLQIQAILLEDVDKLGERGTVVDV